MGDYHADIAALRTATRGIGVLHTREAARRHIGRPDQLKRFDATNFVTEEVIEYRILNAGRTDKRTTLIEISTGMFLDQRLYGVTVFDLRLDMEPRDHDLSTAAHSPEEVADKLREIAGA